MFLEQKEVTFKVFDHSIVTTSGCQEPCGSIGHHGVSNGYVQG